LNHEEHEEHEAKRFLLGSLSDFRVSVLLQLVIPAKAGIHFDLCSGVASSLRVIPAKA
jgi:hypothetical protein